MSSFAKRFLMLIGGFATAGVCVFVLTSAAKYKPYGVPDLRRAEWDAIQAEIAENQRKIEEQRKAEAAGQSSSDVRGPAPRVVVDNFEHDFGMLDPGDSATHTFVVKNRGDAPLILTAGDTSCKCTLSEVSKQLVQPGESAEVSLTWNTGVSREFYRQYAIIKTNDPDNEEIELAVSGTVRTLLDFETEQLITPAVKPGQGVDASVVVYSQTLSDFTIREAECGFPGFAYSAEPLVGSELEARRATTGWKIRLSSDASIDGGNFSEILRIKVDTPDLPENELPLVRELPVTGRVLPPISFYGDNLDSRAGLDLGVTSDGKEKIAKLLIKVRGTRLPEKLTVVKLEPEILEAEVEPLDGRPGVFRLTLKVPAGSPQTIFNREQQHGYVEVADAEDPTFSSWIPIYGAVMKIE